MSIFSEASLSSLLHGFSQPERTDLARKFELRLEKLCQGRLTDNHNHSFYLCIGETGSGHIDHVKQLANNSKKNIVPVLTQDLRRTTLVYRNLIEEGGSNKNEEEPSQNSEISVYRKSDRAQIWVARKIANFLAENGYSIAYPAQPTSVLKGSLLDNLVLSQEHMHISLFVTALPVLRASLVPEYESGNTHKKSLEMAQAIKKCLTLEQAQNIDLYWKPELKTVPQLVATMDTRRNFVTINDHGLRELTSELLAIEPGHNTGHLMAAYLCENQGNMPDIKELTM